MKTKLLFILGVLLIATVAMVGLVDAGLTDSTTITGNPGSYISVAVNQSTAALTLVTDSENVYEPMKVNVTANTIGWTLTAKDAMDNSKSPINQGYMTDWDGTTTYSTVTLLAPMRIQGNVSAGATQGSVAILTAEHTLETGTLATPTSGRWFTMTTWQTVEVNDLHLVDPHVYRIVILFTGYAA